MLNSSSLEKSTTISRTLFSMFTNLTMNHKLHLISFILLLFACRSDIIGTDYRAKEITGTSWKLWSTDTTIKKGDVLVYISRHLADSCYQVISFLQNEVCVQRDSCVNQNPVTKQGKWLWPDQVGLLTFFDSSDNDAKNRVFFNYTKDTLQFRLQVPRDSLYGYELLHLKTYIKK